MSEIRVDNQLVTGMTIDGTDVEEIIIDGCSIVFAKLLRTGWQAVTGGSGNVTVDLRDAKAILAAGIRFQGRSSTTGTVTRDTGYSAKCTTSGSSTCGGNTSVIQSAGTAAFGCSYGSMSYVSAFTRGQLHTQYSPLPQVAVWAAGYGPGTTYPPNTIQSPSLTPRTTVSHLGQSVTASDGNYDRFVISGRAISAFPRTCYSAMNNRAINYNGGITGYYSFILSVNSLAPNNSSGAVQIPHKDDTTGNWFYPIPYIGFTAGIINYPSLTDIDGTGNVNVEIFVVYR